MRSNVSPLQSDVIFDAGHYLYCTLNWTTTQRHVAFADFTSWMLDAFDFLYIAR
ncbi:hypothetical protein KCP76_15490 [Salmonella enterica subsp. enterica serovar Weltevreden]|nr:hypothetical protein KCP76_15490 [Salmonella enterica subsp. enterica serovar Weltevreden]